MKRGRGRPRVKRKIRRRNPQVARLKAAHAFYTKWETERLIEKAGNLAGRLLTIQWVLASRDSGVLTKGTQDALGVLYEAVVPKEVEYEQHR